jgi:hypothetical protein
MLEQGDSVELYSASHRTGGHCRLREVDVLTHREELDAPRHEGLEGIRGLYHDSGLDDLDFAEAYLSQFD